MQITKLTRKSHYYNEDRAIVGDGYFMVIDGATSLYKSNVKPTEASWFVSLIKKSLPKKCNDLKSALNKISQKAFQLYSEMLLKNGLSLKNSLYLPSAGISFAQIKGKQLVINTIGDCEAVIRTKDGNIIRQVVTDLIELDGIALDSIIKTSTARAITVKQATALNKDILIKHRKLMNKPNGYSVFTPSIKPNFKYSEACYKLEDIQELYLYSDGFAWAFDKLAIYNGVNHLFSSSVDVNKVVEQIKQVSYTDYDCNKYPRFKVIDDISVIKITF